uniref:SAM domain-containing protein n=1 Tax=Sphaeramia orbicularis TaxID=375764 RepID=A0A672ZUE0_9TELE
MLKYNLISKQTEYNVALPLLIEDWTKEHVKHWLMTRLKIGEHVAQKLFDDELSGACLVSFEKQDLIDLGVPRAPAMQIIREVKKYRIHSESGGATYELHKGELLSAERKELPDESVETVSVDSGILSQSLHTEHTNDALFLQTIRPIGQIRPFDKCSPFIFYKNNDFLPAAAGPSNLLDPVHEYQLLPSATEVSEREILYEFSKEVFSFAASCLNSRTNGTIHFGVKDEGQAHGQIIGHKITSFSKYTQAFESDLSEYFEEKHINTARMCIRPPVFIQVQSQDGSSLDKWVIEVDVVPTYSETQDNVFYTLLNIASTEKKEQCKTECLFVRDGPRSINILSDSNPRIVQEKMKGINDKVSCWASARKLAEENEHKTPPPCNHEGQRLKQLITRGRDSFQNSLQVIVVTDKCHSSQVEHLDFLKEMKLFAVLEFDPESHVNGTCSFYRKDRIANLHFPHMYRTQDSASVVIKNLNLFKQTSWIFCNGRVNEEDDQEKPLTPSEWLKKRSGDINNMISFLCSPDLLQKQGLLVLVILHSAVTDISSPILEAFCAIYRTLEGADNMLCICKDSTVFNHWKNLVECRCKEDITNKCIYQLSLFEVSSTIKRLKEPQKQSSVRFLPSTGASSVLLAKKDEELMPDLDILCENECENTEIESNNSFQEFVKETEEHFYRGGQISWWNFYLSEQPGCLPFIKRDKYGDLYELITPVQAYTSPCAVINLFHHPGCGGTTLAMHVLWNLRSKFRCAVVKNQMAANKEIAVQVLNLLTYGKHEQSGNTPVLLLVDNWYDLEDLKQCIINIANVRKQPNNLMVMILNCERVPFPEVSSRNSCYPNVFIINKLSDKEQGLFSQKLKELKDYHKTPETFYAFMIMKNNFSEAYITDMVSNIIKGLDTTTQQGTLLSFLALLNTYVNGSYMSLSLCEDLVGIRNPLWKQETLDDKMSPYSALLITFTVEEHGTYQAVRFLHQMIAENCLRVLKHSFSLAEMTINLLHCDKLYKSCMGKDFLVQTIQSMLITRQRKEQGDDKDTKFSPLIEDIRENEGLDQIKEVLEKATVRFDRSATLPQALARHFCLNEKDFQSALKWALVAQSKKSNSYIADTVGQVYKCQLKQEIEDSEDRTAESLDTCLQLACKAVSAFQESQDLARNDEQVDPFDRYNRKRQNSYNTSGYLGVTEVIMMLLDVIKALPIFNVRDYHKRDKLIQFLRGQHPANSLHDHSDTTSSRFVAVLVSHERFLVSLKPKLKEIFSFFENYFTYLRPRHVLLEKETVNERNKRKVSEHFKKYMEIFRLSKEEKMSERARNPKLSLQQAIEDQRRDLEMKQADSFAGLLQCLTQKTVKEIEDIFMKWKFIFDNSGGRLPTSDRVNFILANIVLHSLNPHSRQLKKYEELVDLLNEALQMEGTHSNLTELYYLSMLLMWPSQGQSPESIAAYKNISIYITSAKKSFYRRFSYMFPTRSALAHFFLGKSNGLKRIVAKVNSSGEQGGHSRTMHHLWQSGAAWYEPEVQMKLLRIRGKSENGDLYINYSGNLKLLVRPAYLGDIRSGCSCEDVSFYLGFTMEGPVAYGITYVNN